MVSAIDGSGTSTFWKRRDSAWSFSKICAVLVVRRRADALQRAGGQRRLQQVGRVERAARRGAGADDRVDLVDEEDRLRVLGELLQHRLQALLEIAAVLGAGEQRAHVERVDLVLVQELGHVAFVDAAREALRRSRSCRRRLRRPAADCSCGGGTAPGSRARARARGRSADRSCRPCASALRLMRVGLERALRLAAARRRLPSRLAACPASACGVLVMPWAM